MKDFLNELISVHVILIMTVVFLLQACEPTEKKSDPVKHFIQNYSVPADLQSVLESKYNQQEQTFSLPTLAATGKSLDIIYKLELDNSAFLIKKGLHRLVLRERFSQTILAFGMQYVRVPKKYLFHLPDHGTELANSNYLIVAEFIQGSHPDLSQLSYEIARELLILAMYNRWGDLHDKNIIQNGSAFYIIDSEPDENRTQESVSRRLYKKFFSQLSTSTQDALRRYFHNSEFVQGYPFLQNQ